MAAYDKSLIQQVEAENHITVHMGQTIASVDGFVGNFNTTLANGTTLSHGVAILATGAAEYHSTEYLYGQHPHVVRQLELDTLIRTDDAHLQTAKAVAFIQCVGSRNRNHPYCSKVCCTHSIINALTLKQHHPDMEIFILYRDIRTYGTREDLYRDARSRGIHFFPYSPDAPPTVKADGERITLGFEDPILTCRLSVSVDLLCLATAIVPHRDTALSQFFKVPTDQDGWLLEAHQKLRPVEFANEGVFLCGMAHYPKPVDESIAQAQAAASRAMTVLARTNIQVSGMISSIDPRQCSGCEGCLDVCPFRAITFDHEQKIAEVNPALCKGCGACAATCPSEAPVLMGFSNQQLYAQIQGALTG
jgi:heterodisulfide reductase subunit A